MEVLPETFEVGDFPAKTGRRSQDARTSQNQGLKLAEMHGKIITNHKKRKKNMKEVCPHRGQAGDIEVSTAA